MGLLRLQQHQLTVSRLQGKAMKRPFHRSAFASRVPGSRLRPLRFHPSVCCVKVVRIGRYGPVMLLHNENLDACRKSRYGVFLSIF